MSFEPVRQSVFVRCPVEHAFTVFTERIDGWWPASHRRLQGSRIALEPLGTGGTLVEHADGEALEIGFVTEWNPPASVTLGWRLGAPTGLATSVTISFAEREGGTLVEVVHSDGTPPLPDFPATAVLFTKAWAHVLAAFEEAA
ncbi:MAG: SRPBCC domain-containing protein [Myxococcota bacterium]